MNVHRVLGVLDKQTGAFVCTPCLTHLDDVGNGDVFRAVEHSDEGLTCDRCEGIFTGSGDNPLDIKPTIPSLKAGEARQSAVVENSKDNPYDPNYSIRIILSDDNLAALARGETITTSGAPTPWGHIPVEIVRDEK